MHPSDVSAYVNLQHTSDIASAKRAESAPTAAPQAAAARLDTTTVSAGARALTFHKQSEIAAQALTADKLRELRDESPNLRDIATKMIEAEFDV